MADAITSIHRRLTATVNGERCSAYFEHRPGKSRMLDYRQLDGHCCGFISVLTVVHYFDPGIRPLDVLKHVCCGPDTGVDHDIVVAALAQFGISAIYCDGLGKKRLRKLTEAGTPVIVTVWPDEWGTDHWTVVRSVNLDTNRVVLVNHGPQCGMKWDDFTYEWCPHGGGIVCSKN